MRTSVDGREQSVFPTASPTGSAESSRTEPSTPRHTALFPTTPPAQSLRTAPPSRHNTFFPTAPTQAASTNPMSDAELLNEMARQVREGRSRITENSYPYSSASFFSKCCFNCCCCGCCCSETDKNKMFGGERGVPPSSAEMR